MVIPRAESHAQSVRDSVLGGCTGYVLAGGASSRMGREKAWLPLGPHTLIELAIRRLRPHVERVVVIGHAQNIAGLRALPVDEAMTDAAEGYGPMMGLYTALLHTQTSLNLVVSCDMPRLEPWVMERLLGAWREGLELVAFQWPSAQLQPFPLLCHTRAASSIGRLLERRDLSLQALAEGQGRLLLPIDAERAEQALVNVNTPDDYQALCERMGGSAAGLRGRP